MIVTKIQNKGKEEISIWQMKLLKEQRNIFINIHAGLEIDNKIITLKIIR